MFTSANNMEIQFMLRNANNLLTHFLFKPKFSDSLGGYRSPSSLNLHAGNGAVAGNTSPGQGRSLREYDEKLNALQKENFNLKLRLFFLEEKTPSTGPSKGDDDSLFKQNVDLKVENEELRKELQEKQDLLCQAAKAMELMEDSQKKSTDTSSATISDLTEKIQYLEVNFRKSTIDIFRICNIHFV